MLPVWTKEYEMKTWQTDGERNKNSAGECIQGKPAPVFPEMRTFCWKLSPRSFFFMSYFSVLSTFTLEGLILLPFFPFSCSIPQHRGQHLAGWVQILYLWMGKSDNFHGHCLLRIAAVQLQHINAMQKDSNASHSGFKIINIWLKQIGLDRYKPRAEFNAKCTQKIWIIALCCNLGTDSIQEDNSFWCRKQQFYSHLNFLLTSPGNYLSVRHPLTQSNFSNVSDCSSVLYSYSSQGENSSWNGFRKHSSK